MARLVPIDIVAPGSKGLNTERANALLDPAWATVALNAVINRSGRIAARKGWEDQTTTGIAGSPTIDVLFEYLDRAGVSVIISAAGNKIFKNITDFTISANDITSSTAPTADHWQFVNFNGKVLGFQKGHTPIERSSGDFIDAVYTGTGPDGNCAVAAFGRVWAADADLQTVRYSALLDDTDYSLANGGGTLDMSSIWTNGMDEIVAIAALGANLIVFGRNHIVIWADGTGSEIGLDPTELQVVDTIEGTGTIARDSVRNTGEGDLLFLSRHGIQSLGRVIQFKSNPLVTMTRNIRALFKQSIELQRANDANFDQVRATHSPEEGLYIINFPVPNKQFVLDTTHAFQDEDGQVVTPVTDWILGGNMVGMLTTAAGNTFFGSAGVVAKYAGLSDNAVAYDFEFDTGWLDFGEELNHRLKMLKEIGTSVSIGDGTLVWRWEFDFLGTKLTRAVTYTGGITSEFNKAEFNIGQFAGGAVLQRKRIPAFGEGQFLKLGVTSSVNGFDVIVQQMTVAPKIGRMVT